MARPPAALVGALWCLLAACELPPRAVDPTVPIADAGTARPPLWRRSINLGNALEAPREGDWGLVLQAEHFRIIRAAGFEAVRLPVRWSAHAAAGPPFDIEPAFMERVRWAVDQALANGLGIVVNVHHYEELMQSPAAHRARFLALWQQIAERLKDRPPASVVFELLNEPRGALDGQLWSSYAQGAIGVIRRSNPTRRIIVGGVDWSSIAGLTSVVLPATDANLLLTFHYYSPFELTHQGAAWVAGSDAWLGTTWAGTPAEEEAVRRDLDAAVRAAGGRELYLGEFGVYSKADLASRVRWTTFVAREAEKRAIGWAYWELAAGFGAYDPASGSWRRPLLDALIPPDGER